MSFGNSQNLIFLIFKRVRKQYTVYVRVLYTKGEKSCDHQSFYREAKLLLTRIFKSRKTKVIHIDRLQSPHFGSVYNFFNNQYILFSYYLFILF